MKKKLVGLSCILPNYIDSPKHGVLICEPLECSLEEENCSVDEILPSSKDIFYALNNRLLHNIEGKNSRVYTYNGVSSLTFFDIPILNLVSNIQGDYSVHLSLISPKEKVRSIIAEEKIMFDNIIPLNCNGNAAIPHHLLNNLRGTAISAIHGQQRKEVILIRGYTAQDLRNISLRIFSIMPYAIIIAVDNWQTSLNNFTAGDLLVEDHIATLPLNIPSYVNYRNSPLHRASVTAVINLYKRYDSIPLIYNQLLSQTYPVSQIYVWVNSTSDENKLLELRKQLPLAKFIISDENLGVWARFAYALNNKTEFTVVFDDDTVPGSKWVENCMHQMSKKEALLGTVGLIYKSQKYYMEHQRIGWPSANSSSIVVDIVGHSWFFKTDWLRFYWYEFEPSSGNDFCGEDMHFSFALQKQGIPTMVPPHPFEDKDLWGSLKPVELGTGAEAISVSGKGSHMDVPLQRLVARGFDLVNFCDKADSSSKG